MQRLQSLSELQPLSQIPERRKFNARTLKVYSDELSRLVFIGLTLVLAMPTALPLMALGDKYAATTSEAMRAHYLAAGEAVLATDIWHGTGAYLGGIFVQTGRCGFRWSCCVVFSAS